jgi:hypothetical protein
MPTQYDFITPLTLRIRLPPSAIQDGCSNNIAITRAYRTVSAMAITYSLHALSTGKKNHTCTHAHATEADKRTIVDGKADRNSATAITQAQEAVGTDRGNNGGG